MTKHLHFSALAVMMVGALLGYRVASGERNKLERPVIAEPQPQPKTDIATTPEFVIDDCCTFPGMTQSEFLGAMRDQPMAEQVETSGKSPDLAEQRRGPTGR